MRVAALATALAMTGGIAWADEATMREGLVAGCLAGLPDFRGVEAALTARGWHASRGAEGNERELEKGRTAAFVRSGGVAASPGCTVMDPTVPVPAAERLLEAQLERGFAGRWARGQGYGGSTLWRVPGQGAGLYVTVLGGGPSGEGPGSGISIEIRRE